MKKLSGLNQIVATLVPNAPARPGEEPPKPPTFKEIALNIIALHRPKPGENVEPTDRLKLTNLGLLWLTAKDTLELEDDHFELFKKILKDARAYSEFILGQWQKKVNEIEVKALGDSEIKKG